MSNGMLRASLTSCELSEAYEILSDSDARSIYDLTYVPTKPESKNPPCPPQRERCPTIQAEIDRVRALIAEVRAHMQQREDDWLFGEKGFLVIIQKLEQMINSAKVNIQSLRYIMANEERANFTACRFKERKRRRIFIDLRHSWQIEDETDLAKEQAEYENTKQQFEVANMRDHIRIADIEARTVTEESRDGRPKKSKSNQAKRVRRRRQHQGILSHVSILVPGSTRRIVQSVLDAPKFSNDWNRALLASWLLVFSAETVLSVKKSWWTWLLCWFSLSERSVWTKCGSLLSTDSDSNRFQLYLFPPPVHARWQAWCATIYCDKTVFEFCLWLSLRNFLWRLTQRDIHFKPFFVTTTSHLDLQGWQPCWSSILMPAITIFHELLEWWHSKTRWFVTWMSFEMTLALLEAIKNSFKISETWSTTI